MEEEYAFNATGLIAQGLENHDLKYRVVTHGGVPGHPAQEEVEASFDIPNGHNAVVRFISRDDDNDVAVRIFDVVTAVSEDRHDRVAAACNILNEKLRYFKFYLGSDDCVNAEYDFPVTTPDEAVGEFAAEFVARAMTILKHHYQLFTKALYTDEDLSEAEDTLEHASDAPGHAPVDFEQFGQMLADFRRSIDEGLDSGEDESDGDESDGGNSDGDNSDKDAD